MIKLIVKISITKKYILSLKISEWSSFSILWKFNISPVDKCVVLFGIALSTGTIYTSNFCYGTVLSIPAQE